MIDFSTYEEVKLEDVAEFGRAKQDFVYPTGSSTIQISASKGQVGYLFEKSTVETKNVVIIPQAGIDTYYFNIVLQKNIDEFMCKYATGINVQEKEIGNMPIQLHGLETQKAIAAAVREMDERYFEQERTIEKLKTMKRTLLNQMMV